MKNLTALRHHRLWKSSAVVYLILLLFLCAAAVVSPGYLKPSHLMGLLRLSSFVGIAAIGQTFAILTGGIDLSIANIITFANVIGAQLMYGDNRNIPVAVAAVMLMGLAVGAINAAGIVFLKIPPFIMTLGSGTVVRGVFMIYTNGAPKGNTAPALSTLCNTSIYGVSRIVILWAVLSAIVILVLRGTPFGRRLYSVGDNPEAARFSGIDIHKMLAAVYILSALFSAAAGFLLVGYSGTSFLDAGTEYNNNTIAAVIVGGTAITGGKGGYAGTIAGAVIMTVLEDLLVVINIPQAGRLAIQGAIIILLVLAYSKSSRESR